LRPRAARTALFALSLVVLSGCSLPRGAALQSEILTEQDAETPSFAVVPVTRANAPAIAKWPATGWSGHYHWIDQARGLASSMIREGDLIDLIIWDSQDNSLLAPLAQKSVEMRGLRVSSTGTVFVPYIDEVLVRGLTPESARQRVQEKLSAIAPSAQVQLALTAGQDNSVDLVAGVNRPGTYPLPSRDYTILSLIAQGGGIQSSLEHPVVKLMRGSQTYAIPAESLFGDASNNTTLRGNDKVLVEAESRTFTALGATGSERLVTFPQEHLTVLEALSVIGGLAENRANLEGVLILREYGAKQVRKDGKGPEMQQVVFSFDLTSADGLFAARQFRINPDDTVLATESPIVAARTIFGLFGAVLGLGNQAQAVAN
jgi:polysaccharide export outer membrane protein